MIQREGDGGRQRGGRRHTYTQLLHEYTYLETQYLPNGDLDAIIFNSMQRFPYLVSG